MNRRPTYEVEVIHPGLNKYRHIRGSDRHVVQQKASAQQLVWDEQWERKKAADRKAKDLEMASTEKRELQQLAIEKSEEAMDEINRLHETLVHALHVNDAVDWELLLSKDEYPKTPPRKPSHEDREFKPDIEKPNQTDREYLPNYGILGWIMPFVRRRRQLAAKLSYEHERETWEKESNQCDLNFKDALLKNMMRQSPNLKRRKIVS